MSLIDQLSGQAEPCEPSYLCKNGKGDPYSPPIACRDCRFAQKFPGRLNHWVPLDPRMKKHPDQTHAQKVKKWEEQHAKELARAKRSRPKMKILEQAARAERQTERNIIRATRNSGRRNQDGDHVVAGRITLDTKLQTTRLNPVVRIAELAKVREDARRAGNPVGALVLRNQNGAGFVVVAEEDFALLVKGLEP